MDHSVAQTIKTLLEYHQLTVRLKYNTFYKIKNTNIHVKHGLHSTDKLK